MIDREYVNEFISYVKELKKEELLEVILLFREGVKPPPASGVRCRYAEDTGEKAFPAAPCRGNRIICHKIEGHTSYTKACTPEKCKFYEEG